MSAARIRVPADTRGLEAPPTRDDDAPRQDLGAHFLRHRVGLAGQQRFIDLQAVVGTQDTVGRDLISADQVDAVAGASAEPRSRGRCGRIDAPGHDQAGWGTLRKNGAAPA